MKDYTWVLTTVQLKDAYYDIERGKLHGILYSAFYGKPKTLGGDSILYHIEINLPIPH
jgi:hypothetical protein